MPIITDIASEVLVDKRVLGGLQAAAAVLLACGALIGFAPVSLHQLGCPSAFGIITIETGDSTDDIYACNAERSQRQMGAAAALTLGGALLAGATYVRVDPRWETPVPVDSSATHSSE